MTLRCVFHVSPASPARPVAKQEPRPRAPSVVDVEVDVVEDNPPRGASAETWRRARGWVSED
jgi:hypothetical protein